MTESAAVLMEDGRVVAAAEEERFSRIKHDGGLPYRAIEFVLGTRGLTLADIDHVAVYWNPFQLGHRAKLLIKTLLLDPRFFVRMAQRAVTVFTDARGEDSGWMSLFQAKGNLTKRFGATPKNVHFLDHHSCHMASCFYASSFQDSAILIMDGAGEAACTTWAVGRGSSMEKIDEHLLPHSLGHYYSSVTGYLGFKMLDGEYKMMGLSPYGDPSGSKWIRENFLVSSPGGRYRLNTSALNYILALKGDFQGSFTRHFGPPRELSETVEFNDRHRDIAASAQQAFEDVVLGMSKELRQRTGMSRLSIAGGCGLNCKANGKILSEGIFEEIYVPPVPHDAGGALGAAMLLYQRLTGKRPEPLTHAQYGPEFQDSDIAQASSGYSGFTVEKMETDALIARTAKLLSEGGVVAWFQGKMEYGPRALGNRSFLADPRSDSIRDVINEKIKKRELFRPFAPSVKEEKASEYFEIQQQAPFMTIAVAVRREKRDMIPAVTHVDNTARPQTVNSSSNPKYWKLLDHFEKLTGVPVLLNTSFNIQEPVVCTPREAIKTFSSCGVDALVIENYWVSRKSSKRLNDVDRDAAGRKLAKVERPVGIS
ncbi:MAG: carbamoyltransferase [Elusimicrobia bacterium]|nr:carbamoyltransferase [Elusimicrobiota bacterium]